MAGGSRAEISPIDLWREELETNAAARSQASEEQKQHNDRVNRETLLDVAPIIGNIRSAQRANESSDQFARALSSGEWKTAAKKGGLFGLDVLGTVTGMGFGNLSKEAAKGASSSARIFAGPLAKTADKMALERAQSMKASGASRDDIWRETGWFQGAEGKWRFEIPDNDAALSAYAKDVVKTPSAAPTTGRLYQDFTHPQYREAYPDSEKITQSIGYGRGTGSYWDNRDHIEIRARNPSEAKSIGLHEVQHRVQKDEGFAPGGDMFASKEGHEAFWAEKSRLFQEMMDDPALASKMDEASIFRLAHERAKEKLNRDWYHRNAGEVEARNVETRQHFDPESRRASPPWETQDVPEDQVIVTGGLFGNVPQNVFMVAPESRASKRAYEMRDEGAKNQDIAKETRRFFGPEGKLLMEKDDWNIPVNTVKMGVTPADTVPMRQLFPQHGLFSHIPELGDLPVSFRRARQGSFESASTSDRGYPVLPIGLGEAWDREQLAKLLQYKIAEKQGLANAVTHDPDLTLSTYEKAIRRVQDVVDNPRPGDDLEAAMLWLENANPLFKRVKENATSKNSDVSNRLSKRVAGNVVARTVRERSYGKANNVYPFNQGRGNEQWRGLTTLPQENLTRDELAEFLSNWRNFGVGRDLFGRP